MLKRTITSLILVLIMFPIYLFSHTAALPIAAALLAIIAVYEILGCIGMRAHLLLSIPAYLLAAVLPLSVRFFESHTDYMALHMLVLFVFLLYLFTVGVFSHGVLDIEKIAVVYMTFVYIITSLAAMILLRDCDHGFYLFFMALFGPWGSDVYAYLCGRFFGRHKLIPDISPKKTVEGALGAVIFLSLTAVLFGLVVAAVDPEITAVGYLPLAFAGAVISVVSQVGDLIASYIKRKYGIKDYGFLFPGHGGVLDRFDSVLAVVPMMAILAEFSGFFTFFHV